MNLDFCAATQKRSTKPTESELIGIAMTIAKRRVVDFYRFHSIEINGLEPYQLDGEQSDDSPEKARILAEFWQIAVAELRHLTGDGTAERPLVEAVLSHLQKEHGFPSLRKLGADIWPNRPQTACEVWTQLVERLQPYLKDKGFML